MYFQQTKLSKAEWEHCEVPVTAEEKKILCLIRDGFYDTQIKYNENQTIIQHMKLENTPEIEVYIYTKYFKSLIENMTHHCILPSNISSFLATNFSKTKTLKKNDSIRVSNLDTNFEKHSKNIYEFVILDLCKYIFLLNNERNTEVYRIIPPVVKQSGGMGKDDVAGFRLYTGERPNPTFQADYAHPKVRSKRGVTGGEAPNDGTRGNIKDKKHTAPHLPNHPGSACDKNIKITERNISYYLYNIIQLNRIYLSGTIPANKWVMDFVARVITNYTNTVEKSSVLIREIFNNSPEYIEQNPFILKYVNKELYEHQKQLYSIFNRPGQNDASRMVFYTAPTGTGKTLSPLGLSGNYRIIYICASRHVGLAFAKNAISIEKKVAFAFGCETAGDIRLHYYSAKDYEINRKSGGIYKVDNSNGERVEIMICDLSSYLVAMYYMLSFNDEKNCILYWDEPTISLDIPEEKCPDHPLHTIIREIWKNNKISNIVLSCATLPTEIELMDVIQDYIMKFDSNEIHTINSYECSKTISLINMDKYAVLPHFFFENHDELLACVRNCRINRTILRYFNLEEIVRFVQMVAEMNSTSSRMNENSEGVVKDYDAGFLLQAEERPEGARRNVDVTEYFQRAEELTMNGIKQYYLTLLSSFNKEDWKMIYKMSLTLRKPYWHIEKSTGVVEDDDGTSSENARGLKKIHSLDRGVSNTKSPPDSSIPLTRIMSLQNAAKKTSHSSVNSAVKCNGCISGVLSSASTDGIHLSTIDAHTLTDGVTIFFAEDVDKIGRFLIYQSKIPERVLSSISEKIQKNHKNYEQIEKLSKDIENRVGKDIEKERKMGKSGFPPGVERMMDILNGMKDGLETISLSQQYIPNTPTHQAIWWSAEDTVPNAYVPNIDQSTVEEVMGLEVTMQMKMLLLMGIGVFSEQSHNKYMEIMKRLATEQRLYLIIASCDFIYGMNYQMCHAFFGKDLKEMTQQKIIQAIGRVGRGNIQQEYTIRIRDEEIFRKLFLPQETNVEAINMCRLFSSG